MLLLKPLHIVALAGVLIIGACSEDKLTTIQSGQTSQSVIDAAIDQAVANPNRPDADTADDAKRKPGDVLKFAGVKPGDIVVEMEAGGGYYTELLSRAVGLDGQVIMINPAFFDNYMTPETIPNRLGETGERLLNVTLFKTDFDDLPTESGSADVVTWFLGPHELYFYPTPEVNFGDIDKTYAQIFRVLKPGGSFVVLDHSAPAGAPETTGNTTHRIDPMIIKMAAEKAGFVFEAESDVLRNADDDLDAYILDPKVRRQTDRFLHKYRKPN